ncbi:MAG: hypothetical protein PHY90_07935 [Desulfitobacteriaceae bacterium]|nr:hypothetical protein [Desulfitobacteriaceae bacterium]
MGIFDVFKPKREPTAIDGLTTLLFPNRHEDVKKGGVAVRQLTNKKLSKQASEKLFTAITTLVFIAKDKSAERIKKSINIRTNGILNESEADAIYKFITGAADTPYGGGSGTKDSPIIINHASTVLGVRAEHEYLTQHFGQRDQDWKIILQAIDNDDTWYWDLFIIETADGRREQIYFDITNFFRK